MKFTPPASRRFRAKTQPSLHPPFCRVESNRAAWDDFIRRAERPRQVRTLELTLVAVSRSER